MTDTEHGKIIKDKVVEMAALYDAGRGDALVNQARLILTMIEQGRFNAAFSNWIALGIKLAPRAGVYVGITIEPPRSAPTPESPL